MGLKESRADAQSIQKLFSQFGEVGKVRVKIQGSHANAKVKDVAHTILREGRDGQILTRVMRIPGRFRLALMEYLLGSPPYHDGHPNLQIVLKNTSAKPVKIHSHYHWIADEDEYGNELETGYSEEHKIVIQPGKEKSVSPQCAVHALYDHCKDAWDVTMAAHSWPGVADDIVEVGYSCVINGEAITKKASKRA